MSGQVSRGLAGDYQSDERACRYLGYLDVGIQVFFFGFCGEHPADLARYGEDERLDYYGGAQHRRQRCQDSAFPNRAPSDRQATRRLSLKDDRLREIRPKAAARQLYPRTA